MLRPKTVLPHPKAGNGRGSGLRAALLAALVSWSLGGSAATAQTLTDLGTLPGDVKSIAYGINNAGDVVGISYSSTGTTRAFLWTAGNLIDLTSYLTVYESGAFGINDDGYIVGYFDAAVPVTGGIPGGFTGPGGVTYYKHAFVLRPAYPANPPYLPYTLCDLNGSSSTSTGVAYGINNVVTASGSVGKVAGDKDNTAVLWPDPACPNPTAVPLIGSLPPFGAITSSARGISDTDVVVGWTRWPADNTAPQSAFKWNGGVVTLLSPNQQSLYSHFSEAFGINRQGGHIAGWVEKANESSIYAESWNGSTTGVHIFSDSLLNSTYWGGAFEGKANAVNNSDRIVGYCNTDPGTSPSGPHAFVAAGGSITDLNTCLYLNANWQALVEAKAINDHTNANGSPAGQIVGFGTTSSGATHAFLFTPP